MQLERFYTLFDRKRFVSILKIIAILLFITLIINLIGTAYSRYESTAEVSAEAEIAFFVTSEGTYTDTITFDGLVPSNDIYEYTFVVKNYDKAKRANVDLEYNLSFRYTTNLPILLEVVYVDEDGNYQSISDSLTSCNEDDVYYQCIASSDTKEFSFASNESYEYKVFVMFPESYKSEPEKYQGVIDMLEVTVKARQIV